MTRESVAGRLPAGRSSTTWPLAAAAVALAVLSLGAPAAPGYDPWSWLVWGRELLAVELDTREGPAWKPLPVMVAAVLAAAGGGAAPWLWLVVARAGAILAVLLAFRLGRRLAGGSFVAGAAAALGVLLTSGWVAHGAVGDAEGLLTALLLLAVERGLDGRPGAAFSLGVAAALVRVEVWPFLGVLGALLWTRVPALRLRIAAAAAAVALLWFIPELLGSGELLRSAERARVPNPGAPAVAEHPAVATLATAAGLVPAPLLAGAAWLGALAVGSRRRDADAALAFRPRRRDTPAALAVAAGGLLWIGLVAAMSEAGFSGERRYLLPGAVLLAVAGGAGLGLLGRALAEGAGPARPRAGAASVPPGGWRRRAVAATAVLLAGWAGMATASRVGEVLREAPRLAHGATLARDLPHAIARGGGAERLLRCGPPYVGRYRGPLLAWHLRIPKPAVGFRPARPGVVFTSRLAAGAAPTPPLPAGRPPFARLGRAGAWEVAGACRGRRAR